MGYDVPMKRKSEPKGVIVPILGRIPAGVPIEAIEDIIDFEEIKNEMLLGNKEYVELKITENSMSPPYLENDILIILKQDDRANGQDCIIMVNGDDATFKRVYKSDNGIPTLQPLNTAYMPQFYSNK